MGKFCPFCGKELTDGVCTCDTFKAQNPQLFATAEQAAAAAPAAQQQAQTQEAPAAATAQPQPQAAPVQEAAAKAPSNNVFAVMLQLIVKCFTKPITTAESVDESNKFSALIFLGCYVVTAWLLMVIHVPGVSISGGYRVSTAFMFLFIIVAVVAAKAGIAKIFGRGINVSYLALAGRLSMVLVYPACAFVAYFLFGTFAGGFANVLLACGVIFWVAGSMLVIIDYLKEKSDDMKCWALIATSAAAFFTTILLVAIFGTALLSALVYSMMW